MKTCRVCKFVKPEENFYVRKDTGSLREECKQCYVKSKTKTKPSSSWLRKIKYKEGLQDILSKRQKEAEFFKKLRLQYEDEINITM